MMAAPSAPQTVCASMAESLVTIDRIGGRGRSARERRSSRAEGQNRGCRDVEDLAARRDDGGPGCRGAKDRRAPLGGADRRAAASKRAAIGGARARRLSWTGYVAMLGLAQPPGLPL